MDMFPATDRTTLRRLPERGSYDVGLVHGIFDEALICHVGFESHGPLVLPMVHARIDDGLYLHASTGSGIALGSPIDVCVTATIVDGLVLAKSQFHHSLNYRCVVVRGRASPVSDPVERDAALAAIVDHVSPGRSTTSRSGNARELAATRVLRIPLTEASAKVRSGPANDDEGDHDLPFWSGVVPVRLQAGRPEPSSHSSAGAPGPALGGRFAESSA